MPLNSTLAYHVFRSHPFLVHPLFCFMAEVVEATRKNECLPPSQTSRILGYGLRLTGTQNNRQNKSYPLPPHGTTDSDKATSGNLMPGDTYIRRSRNVSNIYLLQPRCIRTSSTQWNILSCDHSFRSI